MNKLKSFLTVVGAVTVLVLAANTVAYAATGGKFLLGMTNKANKASTLKRTTSGPALNLVTKPSGTAPLTVNSNGKVANLNADLLDGLDASQLSNRSYVFTKDVTTPTTLVNVAVPVPPGTYTFGYSAFMSGATNTAVGCELFNHHPGASDVVVGTTGFNSGSAAPGPGVSGAGVVSTASGDVLHLWCTTGAPFTTQPGLPIQLVMTPTTVVGGGGL